MTNRFFDGIAVDERILDEMSPADVAVAEATKTMAEHARDAVDLIAHEESLLLCAQRLALAARGTVALHLFREDGLWHVESWRDGEMVESYVGVPSIADALDRIGDWMRAA